MIIFARIFAILGSLISILMMLNLALCKFLIWLGTPFIIDPVVTTLLALAWTLIPFCFLCILSSIVRSEV